MSKVGERFVTNEGYVIEVIKYSNYKDCDIKFATGLILYRKNFSSIKSGAIKNPYHPSVHNIGYLGEGKYTPSVNNRLTKIYNTWSSMLERCYCQKYQERYPTYVGCSIIKEWECFQNFAKWFEENYIRDFHLDKDILIKGNKIYSPKTCCFVPVEINILLIKNNSKRGSLAIGVSKNGTKFQATISKGTIREHLGTFETSEEAFEAYKITKEEYIKELADKWREQITEQVYQALINYKVEIDD